MNGIRNRCGAARPVSKSRWGFGPPAALALLCLAQVAAAQSAVGTVVHLSGVLSAKRADGTTRLLAAQSAVREGDTLVTEADTSMELRFVDDSVLVLSPATQMRVTRYVYDPAEPARDAVALDLLSGGFRSVTGRLGHRNHDAIRISAGDAVIKVQGTTFVATFNPPASPLSPGPAPGLYLHVLDGQIVLSNQGGSQGFAAGQFGYVGSTQQPPVVVPANPGVVFTPPPAFSMPTRGTGSDAGTGKSGTVDCEVR